jgi:parvulin-like peptidyl-prolyl isomerase
VVGVRPALAADDANDPVAVTVNGEPIHESEVKLAIAATGKDKLAGDSLATAQAETLAAIIDGRLIDQAIRKSGIKVDDKEIDEQVSEFDRQVAAQKIPPDQGFARMGLSRASFRPAIDRALAWKKYLQANVTDKAVQEYFAKNKASYDGTKVRVSHILLRPAHANSNKENFERIAQIRDQIEKKEISFADAAQKYSEGPSRAKQGDLGFIPRHGVMDEEFSRAAFALKPGELSRPVVSKFGVHLITATDVEPGDKTWSDVREPLQMALVQELHARLARAELAKAKLEFTGALPYFKPGTKELVVGKQ